MLDITNISDRLQVIPSKGGSKDLQPSETDTFDVSRDNPHVQAKVRAGFIRIEDEGGAESPEAEKPTPVMEASPRPVRASGRTDASEAPGGSSSTL